MLGLAESTQLKIAIKKFTDGHAWLRDKYDSVDQDTKSRFFSECDKPLCQIWHTLSPKMEQEEKENYASMIRMETQKQPSHTLRKEELKPIPRKIKEEKKVKPTQMRLF